MRLDNKTMLKLLKEEYDKRLNHYLGEIEVKAKHSKSDSELVNDAMGLKLKNRAGHLFTLVKIEQDESGQIFAYLAPPGDSVEYNVSSSKGSREEEISDDYIVGDESEEEGDYIYSTVTEDEEKKQKKDMPEKDGVDKKNLASNSDLRDPNPKAKFKKQLKIDVDADVGSYEEVDGLVKVSMKVLEDDFTL